MMKQYAAAALCCWCWTVLAESASAQNMELSSRDLIRVLQSSLDMKDWQNPGMTLKEMLGLTYEKTAAFGVALPILVDQQAFKDDDPKAGDIYESVVRFPPYPKTMTVATALKLALSQVPKGNATFLVRRGAVIITSTKHAAMADMLKQTVLAHFQKTPFDEALYELAEQSGVSIQLDSRAVKDKQNIQVSALFRNDTSLRDALVMLADMAGLKVVELPSGVYVTSPANAETLEKTLRDKAPKTPAK